jgi:hypothetical protein
MTSDRCGQILQRPEVRNVTADAGITANVAAADAFTLKPPLWVVKPGHT